MAIGKSAIFVDTSGWAEPLIQNTPMFRQMSEYSAQLLASQRQLVTTDDVIGEMVALLTARAHQISRAQLLAFVGGIMATKQLTIVHVDTQIFEQGWDLLNRSKDKEWSLVDACSFVVMRQYGLTEAFTSDHHFQQAGFLRMPQHS